MTKAQRRLKDTRDSIDKDAYLVARNQYFQAIKNAKREHKNQFLEKTDLKSIFKAIAYTKTSTNRMILAINRQENFNGKCNELRKALFLSPL